MTYAIKKKTAIITGSSGFIGFHLSKNLLDNGYRVIGVDNLSDYYDVSLKMSRQSILSKNKEFEIVNANVEEKDLLLDLLSSNRPDVVVHLAAQAGVRYSIENPRSYLDSNICGTFEVLEAIRAFPPKHTLIASTSSVFGANSVYPYSEMQQSDHQMSFYAATKKATEVMSHSYAHIYDLPITMFRFFTVYGPWGRPDMALFRFVKAILHGDAIDVYNYGEMRRDFTYIDDLINAITLLIDVVPKRTDARDLGIDSLSPVAPWRVVNIGNSQSVQLTDFITAIEKSVGKSAVKNLLPMQAGDVPATWADASLLNKLTGYHPETDIQSGVDAFVNWYKNYYL